MLVRLAVFLGGIVTFQGKEKLYKFSSDTPVEVDEVDLPEILSKIYTSGGCCGSPQIQTPFFIKVE